MPRHSRPLHAVRDPIHRTISLESWAVELVDAREMQRLRRIRQLGTAFLVYPGANHTRFEHGLGAYKLAQDATRRFGLESSDARAVQAAALLHDVGHGPLSHLFEEIDPSANLHHEGLSADLIRWSGIADRLRAAEIDPAQVAQLVQGHGAFARLVSGDLDVDRMDYLVRDAHYTGLRVSVDPERLLDTLILEDGVVLVEEDGLTATEALLVARFLMYPAVYFHHACRSAETMIVRATRSLLQDGAKLDELRILDDGQLMEKLACGPPLAKRMATRVAERRLHKRAWQGRERDMQADAFLQRLTHDLKFRDQTEAELAEECGLDVGEVIVDVPRAPMAKEVDVNVVRPDGTREPLREASTLVRSLLVAQLDHWRAWVFAPKDARGPVRDAFSRRLEPKTVKRDPELVADP